MCVCIVICSVEVVFDDQCDVTWTLPEGVETIPLFQTTSFNIDGECLDLIGGVQGRTFHFQVREGERTYIRTYIVPVSSVVCLVPLG